MILNMSSPLNFCLNTCLTPRNFCPKQNRFLNIKNVFDPKFFWKEVIGRNTDLANDLLLAGTVLANNLLLAETPPGPFQESSRTLLGLLEPL